MMELHIATDMEMIRLGERLGSNLKTGDLLFLFGDLGAGKTTLTKGIAAGMGVEEPVTSPTFQLKKTYDGKITLNHLDLYRLDNPMELEILDPDELLEEGVTVVEWGKLLKDRLQTEYLEIMITIEMETGSRKVTLIPFGDRYCRLLEELKLC